MPDRLRARTALRTDPLVASAAVVTRAMTRDRQLFQPESWQNEGWRFYDDLGELHYGITWRAKSLSRVRLMAAEQVPGGDEPEPLLEGPAADLIEQFGGGISGRAQIMESFGVQIGVPGEGWLVAERPDARTPLELANWSVKSTDEIRASKGRGGDFEIQVDDNVWRELPPESLVARIHEPHKRWSWKADSSIRSAIPIMREIDLYNRRIITTMVSRLAMNGILLIPQEGVITVPEQYQDSPDPFVQMLLEIAASNIKNPGGASASIPIPIRFPSEWIEKWKHLTFGDGVDEPLLKAREDAIGRLGTTLEMPAEVLTGVGDVNHWTSWQLSDEGIKLYISPAAETIVGGVTVGYLHPMLTAAGHDLIGPSGGKIVVWYDTSELAARPDKSAQALQAYDRVEISGTALRRESGFDEGDAPDDDEIRAQVLKKLAVNVQNGMAALAELVGDPSLALPQAPVAGVPQPSGPGGDGGEVGGNGDALPAPAATPATGPPPTRNVPPPAPGPDVPVAASTAAHAVDRYLSALRAGEDRQHAALAAGSVNGNGGRARDGPKRRNGP